LYYNYIRAFYKKRKNHYVKQEYKPHPKVYYIPTEMGYEKKIKEWLEGLKKHE
jgi:putative ATPase